MGKQSRGGERGRGNRFKKEFNNYNPYNTLELNKYHQINNKQNHYGHQLHKKKRDLERMIEYRKNKGLEIEQEKMDELQKIEGEMGGRKRDFEKQKRKEFFIAGQYKQIMNIEKRKVANKLRQIKAKEPIDQQQLVEWYKKLNYIKFFPKTLKYVALFPNTPLSEKAKEFQNKIMSDVEADLAKKNKKLNSFQPEYKVAKEKRQKKDDFFLENLEEKEGEEEEEEDAEQEVDDDVEEQQAEQIEEQESDEEQEE